MFNIDPRDFKSSAPTMDFYREWAGEIGKSYLSAGDDPTQTLIKIARSEELTPHQIEVLAAEANKLIHTAKFATADEKYFAADFPHADAKQAVQTLQLNNTEKVAKAECDPILPKDDFDAYAVFGIKAPEPMDKTASVKQDLRLVIEKTAALKSKVQDLLIVKEATNKAAENNFIKKARQFLIDDSGSRARMATLESLEDFCKQAGFKFAYPKLAKLAYVCMREGLLEKSHAQPFIDQMLKQADCTAPESMISETLPARVINGSHPLYITLKTIGDQEAEFLRYGETYKRVDDKLRILQQKVRAL